MPQFIARTRVTATPEKTYTIRKLPWRRESIGGVDGMVVYRAYTIIGTYEVQTAAYRDYVSADIPFDNDSRPVKHSPEWSFDPNDDRNMGPSADVRTIAEGKARAQQHYEDTLAAALEEVKHAKG